MLGGRRVWLGFSGEGGAIDLYKTRGPVGSVMNGDYIYIYTYTIHHIYIYIYPYIAIHLCFFWAFPPGASPIRSLPLQVDHRLEAAKQAPRELWV